MDKFRKIVLNAKEQELYDKLAELERYIPGDWEMELHRTYAGEVNGIDEDGWYVSRYSEEAGEAIPLEVDGKYVFFSDKYLEEEGINIDFVVGKYGCYVSV